MKITPIGYSAQKVTGSCNKIEYLDKTLLVECGGIQEGRTPLENYNLNRAMIQQIKSKKIDFIFLLHSHFDHIGLVPTNYSNGCKARLIVPKGGYLILREMWLDSAKIMEKDCIYLSKKFGKEYTPFYTIQDVENTLQFIEEFDSGEIFNINEELSFRFIPAGHIAFSQQLELFIKLNNHTNKILITSDLGNLLTQDRREYVDKFVPVQKANVVIGESTYGRNGRQKTKKDFEKDLEKIKAVIEQFCVDGNGRVLIPAFSLDKTPIILTYLYDIFGNDSSFKVPIIVDSPLGIRLLKCYEQLLTGEAKVKFDRVMAWDNIKLITDHKESASCMLDMKPKVLVSSGGMIQSGRCISWAQSIIPRSNDAIMFMGYCGANTLGWKIKNLSSQKTVTINNKVLKNRCQIIELSSFSSHMQQNDLINYYKSIQADKIYLLHGDEQSRIDLKNKLQEELSNSCKTTKVSIVNKSTVITL